jgi:hypothetical protein
MVSRIGTTTIDARDPYALAAWWKTVLGYVDDPDAPGAEGDEECEIVDPATGTRLLFQRVPEGKTVKNRLHFDLAPTDRTRDEELERVVAHGARVIDDLRAEDGTGWVVLVDPEGNEFCIVRSDAERAVT